MQGVILSYFPEKAFGFILTGDSREVYFHRSNFSRGTLPVAGARVTFEYGPAFVAGKPDQAVQVRYAGSPVRIESAAGGAL